MGFDKGLSLREVSLKAGKNEQFVRDIVSGRIQSPTVDGLSAVAKVLGVQVGQLLGEKPTYSLDLEIMGACMLWVMQNSDKLAFLSHEEIVDELMRQYGRMLNDRINDKAEAVRITRYLFENLQDQKLPELSTPAKSKAVAKKPKSSPPRSAKKS